MTNTSCDSCMVLATTVLAGVLVCILYVLTLKLIAVIVNKDIYKWLFLFDVLLL